MTMCKLILLFILIGLYSCGQNNAKHKVDPTAVSLNNKAMTLVKFIDNEDSSKKAISVLDNATAIDSNYFLGYYNKLMFLDQLKQYDKSVLTVNKLIQLRPYAHDLYLTAGIIYERKGNTSSSKIYFEKSLAICNKVLDTIKISNSDYIMLISNKVVNLIMLNRNSERDMMVQEASNQLYDSNLWDKNMEIALNSLYELKRGEIVRNNSYNK